MVTDISSHQFRRTKGFSVMLTEKPSATQHNLRLIYKSDHITMSNPWSITPQLLLKRNHHQYIHKWHGCKIVPMSDTFTFWDENDPVKQQLKEYPFDPESKDDPPEMWYNQDVDSTLTVLQIAANDIWAKQGAFCYKYVYEGKPVQIWAEEIYFNCMPTRGSRPCSGHASTSP